MADYEQSRIVDGRASDIYDYLADPGHLTGYVATMVKAQVVAADHLHVAADISRGHEEGEAMFRADASARRLEWGGLPDHGYHGWLAVADGDSADTSTVTIHLATRDDADHDEIERAIAQTLDNIGTILTSA